MDAQPQDRVPATAATPSKVCRSRTLSAPVCRAATRSLLPRLVRSKTHVQADRNDSAVLTEDQVVWVSPSPFSKTIVGEPMPLQVESGWHRRRRPPGRRRTQPCQPVAHLGHGSCVSAAPRGVEIVFLALADDIVTAAPTIGSDVA